MIRFIIHHFLDYKFYLCNFSKNQSQNAKFYSNNLIQINKANTCNKLWIDIVGK